MKRFLGGLCALVLVFPLVVRGDDSKEENKKTPEQAFQALMGEIVKEFRAAEGGEKLKVLSEGADKLFKFAEQNPKSPAALQALGVILSMPLPTAKDGVKAKAVERLKKDHVTSKAIGQLMRQLSGSDPATLDLLQAILDKNPEKKIKAEALKGLIKARESALVDAKGDKADEIRKEIDSLRVRIKNEFDGLIKDLFIGAKMPELESKDLDDKKVKLSDLKGKVVVLDCWATWCPPCRAMIPHSRKLVERLKDKPFVLVSVSFDDNKETLTKFMEENKMPWTHWFNGADGGIAEVLDITYFPTIYILDHKGIIRYKDVRDKAMDKAVDKLLEEMEKETKGK